MEGLGSETISISGVSLIDGKYSHNQYVADTDKKLISKDENQKKALIAELKEQYSHMSDAVKNVLETYNVDQLKDVKETLKVDGEKFQYMLNGDCYVLSGGFLGKPFNIELRKKDGSIVRTSDGQNYASAVVYDEKGNLKAHVQENKKTDQYMVYVAEHGQNGENALKIEDGPNEGKFSLFENGETVFQIVGDEKNAEIQGKLGNKQFSGEIKDNQFSVKASDSEEDSYLIFKERLGSISSVSIGVQNKQNGAELHLEGEKSKNGISMVRVRENDNTESSDYKMKVSGRGTVTVKSQNVNKVNGDVERKSVKLFKSGKLHEKYVKENDLDGTVEQLELKTSPNGRGRQKYKKENKNLAQKEEISVKISGNGTVRDEYKFEDEDFTEYLKEEKSKKGSRREEYKKEYKFDEKEEYQSYLNVDQEGNAIGKYEHVIGDIKEKGNEDESGNADVKNKREDLKKQLLTMRDEILNDTSGLALENINDENWMNGVKRNSEGAVETNISDENEQNKVAQTSKQILPLSQIIQNCPINKNQEKQPYLVDTCYDYSDVKINRIMLNDGSYKVSTLIDDKKHGAEILYDKYNNIQNVNVYNMGQLLDNKKHKIEIKVDTENDIVHQYMLLDDKKFGTETFTNDSTMFVSFYQENGDMMRRKDSSIVSYNESQLPEYDNVNDDTAKFEHNENRSDTTKLSKVNNDEKLDSVVSSGYNSIKNPQKEIKIDATLLKSMVQKCKSR